MPNIFSGGLAKLTGSRSKGSSDASGKEAEQPLQYEGKLSGSLFGLSEGAAFGLGAVQPQTLAYEPCTQTIAVCGNEGHVHLLGAGLELCLRNPCAPVRVEFLLFPRPGFALLLGVAPGGSAGSQGSRPRWLAQWWDVQEARDSARMISHTISLRFGVTSVAVADATALVFLGTDEGDVRVFDAGSQPGIAEYCIPWPRLQSSTDHTSDARPCPVTAMAMAPAGVCELLVGGAEGCIALWAIEKHKSIRTFDAEGPVNSMAWHSAGVSFVVAVRGDLLVFNKTTSTVVAKVPLPGGPAQSCTLLQWTDAEGPRQRQSPQAGEAAVHGELLLRRGSPSAAVLNLWGPSWAQADKVMEDSSAIEGAILCRPSSDEGSGGLGSRQAVPPGCLVPPWAMEQQSISEDMNDAGQRQMEVLELFASSPLVLAITGDDYNQLLVATLPPAPSLVWPAMWGSSELAGVTCHCLPCHLHNEELEEKTLGGAGDREAGLEEQQEQDPKQPEDEEVATAAPVAEDAPPLASALSDEAEASDDSKKRFGQMAEDMFARRFANFISFLDGREVAAKQGEFADTWNSMTGGWLGSLCTGHSDGSIRIWLRAHTELLLLQTVSVISLPPLPGRPQLEPPSGGASPPADGAVRLRTAVARGSYDSIDACPAVPTPDFEADPWKAAISAVAFSPEHRLLAAATASGSVSVFEWNDAASRLSLGELERWAALQSNESNPAPAAQMAVQEELAAQSEEAAAPSEEAGAAATDEASPQASEAVVDMKPPPEEESAAASPCCDSVVAETPASEQAEAVATKEAAQGEVAAESSKLEQEVCQRALPALSLPLLPAGFACLARIQEHKSPVKWVRLLEAGAGGSVHLVSADSSGQVCIFDVTKNSVLYSGQPCTSSQDAATPPNKAAGGDGNGVAAPPPVVTVDSCIFSEQVLHLASDALGGSTGDSKSSKALGTSSSSLSSSSKHGSEVAAARAAAEMAMKLMQSDEGDAAAGLSQHGAFVMVLSNGAIRQLSYPDMRILDWRIQQSRLPTLPCAATLLHQLRGTYMVVVQANAAHVLMRGTTSGELCAPRTFNFEGRAVCASLHRVHGEDCLYILTATLTVQVFALPTMTLLTSIDTTPKADPFLVQLSLQRPTAAPQQASNASSTAFSPGERGACIGHDGYVAFRSGGAAGSRIWLASCQAECKALDAAAWMSPVARIAQAVAPVPMPSEAPMTATASSSTAAKGIGGFFGNLLGAGPAAPRGVRASVRPMAGGLPAEVDATKIDKSRGLPRSWQECDMWGRPPPPPPPSSASSSEANARAQLLGSGPAKATEGKDNARGAAVSGAKAAMEEANKKAHERGDKLSELAQKSQQMQKDSEDFLKMAKQLNQRNKNSWF